MCTWYNISPRLSRRFLFIRNTRPKAIGTQIVKDTYNANITLREQKNELI